LSRISTLRERDYLDRVVRGGYPEAIRRSPRRRAAFFDSYLTSLIERDVKELSAIKRHGDLRRLLALLAGRTGGLLVPATLAAASGIPRTTLNRYLDLLSAAFLIKQIPDRTADPPIRRTPARPPYRCPVELGTLTAARRANACRLAAPGRPADQGRQSLLVTKPGN
jgi:uncharacterized protein